MSESGSAPPPLLVGLQVSGWPCLVVGGGAVATRRVLRLVEAGATVTVVAPEATDAIAASDATWLRRAYQADDVAGMALVVTATGDPEVDAAVVAEASAARALVNDATDPDRGSTVFPAAARSGTVQVAVSTGGLSPSLGRWLAGEIAAGLLGPAAAAAELMASIRHELRAVEGTTEHPGWSAAVEDGLVDLIRGGRHGEAEALLRRHLGLLSS
jgi:siroheme synthase-like protein